MSLRFKLIGLFLAIGLIPLSLVGWFSVQHSSDALMKQASDRLKAVLQVKKTSLESYFRTIHSQAITFSENRMTTEAFYALADVYQTFHLENDLNAEKIQQQRQALKRFIKKDYNQHYRTINATASRLTANMVDQLDDNSVALQYQYIVNNPNPSESKSLYDKGEDDSSYSTEHETFHKIFRHYLDQFGYYDLFLISHKTNHVIYSVAKEFDFATSLVDGPFAQSGLGMAFQHANRLKQANEVVFVDYAPHLPSFDHEAAFVASPVFEDNFKVGILIFQIPTGRINAVMQERTGLGKTGETFLIGHKGPIK